MREAARQQDEITRLSRRNELRVRGLAELRGGLMQAALATGAEVERVRGLINDAVRQLGAAFPAMDRHARHPEQAVAGLLAQTDRTRARTAAAPFRSESGRGGKEG